MHKHKIIHVSDIVPDSELLFYIMVQIIQNSICNQLAKLASKTYTDGTEAVDDLIYIPDSVSIRNSFTDSCLRNIMID